MTGPWRLLLVGGVLALVQAIVRAVHAGVADVEYPFPSVADAVGLARAMVLEPGLPHTWLNGTGGDPAFPAFDAPAEGAVTAWYTMRLTALGDECEAAFKMTAREALKLYEARDAERCKHWRSHFS